MRAAGKMVGPFVPTSRFPHAKVTYVWLLTLLRGLPRR